ncbi:DUF2922 family protein [Enterococcus pallens]|uniref:DUF2922 family protein n=1 Tax=Enterococcus pallens ATCC BAA-351 TaxID=1158607 RepID=R2SEE2_9ENTE|nr:DUF2922 family protein [Enterococcus pallens]EOH86494.1 hypothetical protein UAU_04934 [Enterococcus pallens ATCC BAA-351]EOU18290.1 hypothetical protein I588_03279 [Enterococcus pallens ATCC BAA-351]OJG81397.1 hypothetical protein RV10_GL003525 [Enterococcus pallens]
MIKLVSTFLNSAGKTHNFTVKDPDTTKSPEEIKESLKLLSSLHLFEKDGVELFQEVVKAKFVETIEHPIFEGDELFGVPAPIEESPEEEAQLPEEVDPSSLEELKAKSTRRELPQVPRISLSSLANKEVYIDELNEQPENSFQGITGITIEEIAQRTSPVTEEPSNKPYDIVKEMFKRKLRRRKKEQERQNSPDSSS